MTVPLVNPCDVEADVLESSSKTAFPTPKEVHIHPLVLLSAVDHFVRINNHVSSGKRVAGILLGERHPGNVLDVNNSFAVPFEEDVSNPDVWFMDGNYIKEMFVMVRKVWSRTKIVGWYSSGPKICRNDISIHQMMRAYCPNPVYCIIDVDPKEGGQPTASYACIENVENREDGVAVSASPSLTFLNLHTVLSAIEGEEIGVEQLLRDLTDSTVSTLSSRIKDRQSSLATLQVKLTEIREYLDDVIAGKLPRNHEIFNQVQEVFNVLPNIHQLQSSQGMIREVNDIAISSYVGSMIRCLLALDALITNKRQIQQRKAKKEKEREEKEKEKVSKTANTTNDATDKGIKEEGKSKDV